jgi:hypothetical protein
LQPSSCAKSAPQKRWTQFSGEKAFAHVQKLVGFDLRPSGSHAIERARAYMTEQLKSFGWTVTEQPFAD